MWIYEIDTLFFLDVNEAAINNYGFSYKEFLSMTINDIRPKYNAKSLLGVANLKREKKKKKFNGFFRHQKKNGEIIIVEVTSNLISHNGKMVRIILANDITERLNYIKACPMIQIFCLKNYLSQPMS